MSDISDMQHAINRYFGNLIGSPIAEDGIVGPQTTDALNAIISGLPGVGYPDTGGNLQSWFQAQRYSDVTNTLNAVADQQNWLYDSSIKTYPSFASGGASPVRIHPTKPITAPTGAQASLNTIASKVGLPTWGLLLGVGGVAVILLTRRQRRKSKRR